MSLSPEEREILRETLNKTLYGYELTEAIWIAAKNYGMRHARDLLIDLRHRESDASLQKGIELVSIVINTPLKDKHG